MKYIDQKNKNFPIRSQTNVVLFEKSKNSFYSEARPYFNSVARSTVLLALFRTDGLIRSKMFRDRRISTWNLPDRASSFSLLPLRSKGSFRTSKQVQKKMHEEVINLANELTQKNPKQGQNFSIEKIKVNSIQIGLAWPELLRKRISRKLPNGKILGLIRNPKTVNYRTLKPFEGGLYCERIFGPTTSFICGCDSKEKENKIDYCKETKTRYCVNCDVELTESKIRRKRFGYIELHSPVIHPWFLYSRPNYLLQIFGWKEKIRLTGAIETGMFFIVKKSSSNTSNTLASFQTRQSELENISLKPEQEADESLPNKNVLTENFSISGSYSDNVSLKGPPLYSDIEIFASSEAEIGQRGKDLSVSNLPEEITPALPVRSKDNKTNVVDSKNSLLRKTSSSFGTQDTEEKSVGSFFKQALENETNREYGKSSLTDSGFRLKYEPSSSSNFFLPGKSPLRWPYSVRMACPEEEPPHSVRSKRVAFEPPVVLGTRARWGWWDTLYDSNYDKELDILKSKEFRGVRQALQKEAGLKKGRDEKGSKTTLYGKKELDKEKDKTNFGNFDILLTRQYLSRKKFNFKKKTQWFFYDVSRTQPFYFISGEPPKKGNPLQLLRTTSLLRAKLPTRGFTHKEHTGTAGAMLVASLEASKVYTKKKRSITYLSTLFYIFRSRSLFKVETKIEEQKIGKYRREVKTFIDQWDFVSEALTVSPHGKDKEIPFYKNYIQDLFYSEKSIQENLSTKTVNNSQFASTIKTKAITKERGGTALASILQSSKIGSHSVVENCRKMYELIALKTQKFKQKTGLLNREEREYYRELLKIRDAYIRRGKLFKNFSIRKKNRPDGIVISVVPVLPPDLRPIIKLSGNVLAVSDLTKLYQLVFYRNQRLALLSLPEKIDLSPPSSSFISVVDRLRSIGIDPRDFSFQKKMVQNAVTALMDNGKGGTTIIYGSNGQPLKSLSAILKGKKGRFRQNLLGKRVDYSGRSVIVVGPKLKLHQCGLPKEMAIELFQPFLVKRLVDLKIAGTIRNAKRLIFQNIPIVWEILSFLLETHPILLNRAPTLHRLGIQAFQPKLVDGRAILLHPLVCPAFNADFDGDQMAVHVPLSFQARAEAWNLMWGRQNFLSPATGQPILVPSQDMVLGCYYLTTQNVKKKQGHGLFFSDVDDLLKAFFQNKIDIHAIVWLRWHQRFETEVEVSHPLEFQVTSFGQVSKIDFTSYRVFHFKNSYWSEWSFSGTGQGGDLNDTFDCVYPRSGVVQFIRTTPGRALLNKTLLEISGCFERKINVEKKKTLSSGSQVLRN